MLEYDDDVFWSEWEEEEECEEEEEEEEEEEFREEPEAERRRLIEATLRDYEVVNEEDCESGKECGPHTALRA